MHKKLLGLSVMFMVLGLWVFADNMETITLTTYYPAPYGVYFQLATKRLSVGLLAQADQPNRDGDARFQPQPGDPAKWPQGQPGQLAYSKDNDAFYHSNGRAWIADSGISGTVIYLDCGWGPSTPPLTSASSSCIPPSCPDSWKSLGVSNRTTAVFTSSTRGQFYTGISENVCVKN